MIKSLFLLFLKTYITVAHYTNINREIYIFVNKAKRVFNFLIDKGNKLKELFTIQKPVSIFFFRKPPYLKTSTNSVAETC